MQDKKQTHWLNYLDLGLTHCRMDYSVSVIDHLSIENGSFEIAVRFVINLRVKSNVICRLRENTDSINRFHAWIKAGRAYEPFPDTNDIATELAV